MLLSWTGMIAITARRVWSDRRAQDLVEYSLAAAFVAVAVSAFFPPAIAPAISGVFSKLVGLFALQP